MVVSLEVETAVTLLGLGIAGTNAYAYGENGAPGRSRPVSALSARRSKARPFFL